MSRLAPAPALVAALAALVVLAALVCCRTGPGTGEGVGEPARVARPPQPASPRLGADLGASDASSVPAGPARREEGEPVVLVTDREALAYVEEHGGDFGSIIDGEGARGAPNDALWARPAWRSIGTALSADVREVQRSDPHAGVEVARFPHRVFDVRWLSSATARFELVGVVNRIDRRPFHASACGETRLVFRLGYRRVDERGRATASRLPMTINVELRAGERDARGECREAAARWFAPRGATGAALGRWLTSEQGPLSRAALSPGRLAQIVVNMQSVRWPSAVRPDLGGHAEYVLRAFAPRAGGEERYLPRPLENTPDVARLRRSPELRAELLAWLREPAHLRGLDEATSVLPDKFLATRVVSVTPRGFARLANRPFRQLFEPRDVANLVLADLRFARSPEALLRRLDDTTCSGCHQRRAVAGFHLLGEDPPDTAPGNALAVAFSPHMGRELARRRTYLASAHAGGALDDARPFAERADASDNGYGAACGLGDPGFASWTCAAGLRCDAYESPVGEKVVGVCLPEVPSIGDPCDARRITSDRDPHRDRAGGMAPRSCAAIAGVCESSSVGFPGGMCESGCATLPPKATCGAIAILADFNACIARKNPFHECLANNVRPGGLRACSDSAPCRDDYICARGASGGGGACIPPYFLFQLRVDGHSP